MEVNELTLTHTVPIVIMNDGKIDSPIFVVVYDLECLALQLKPFVLIHFANKHVNPAHYEQ